MIERGKRSEIEFWQGHSLNDDCPWRNVESSILDEIHATFAKPDIRQMFNRLREFTRTNEGRPIKKLTFGEQFKLSDFPKGTIIRFSRDKCWMPFFRYKTHSYQDEWGILTQEEFRGNFYDVVVGFSKGQLEDDYPPLHPPHMFYGDLTIGETVHTRTIEPDDGLLKIETFLKVNRRQRLARINWIALWRFGEGVRARAEERHPIKQ